MLQRRCCEQQMPKIANHESAVTYFGQSHSGPGQLGPIPLRPDLFRPGQRRPSLVLWLLWCVFVSVCAVCCVCLKHLNLEHQNTKTLNPKPFI